MKYTNVFCTKEELKECQELAVTAASTPVMRLSSSSPCFAETAWQRVHDRCNALAEKHGLPKLHTNYGLSEKGEFLTTD